MSAIRTAALALALSATPAAAADLSWSAMTGWQDGWAFRGGGTVSRLVPDLPLGIGFSAGLTFMDPGDPWAARRVFINDNAGGTPESSGYAWDLRLDGIWFVRVPHLSEAGVFAGVRYNSFSGRFKFVGDNEDFTVTSDVWGLGAGFRGALPVSPRWSLNFAAGLDWFPVMELYGHSTTFRSSGANVNVNTGYTFQDASAAMNRWSLLPSVLVGASWK
jgi:hypothetical protein